MIVRAKIHGLIKVTEYLSKAESTDRDVAAAQVVVQRGLKKAAVGRTVQVSEGERS